MTLGSQEMHSEYALTFMHYLELFASFQTSVRAVPCEGGAAPLIFQRLNESWPLY